MRVRGIGADQQYRIGMGNGAEVLGTGGSPEGLF